MVAFNYFASIRNASIATIDKPSINKISLPKTSDFSFLDAFKAVEQAKSQPEVITVRNVEEDLPRLTVTQKKDVKLPVPHLIQGKNECGPTSLAMIEKYYGINPGNYHKMFSSDTVGHGPLALRSKAINKGLVVRQENYGSLEDLAALTDKGIPVMALGIMGGGKNSSLSNYIDNASRAHWMVVTGYKKDENGQITHIYFNDPNKSKTQCWTAKDFKEKFWDNNIMPGGHRYYMAMAKEGTFQEKCLKKYLPEDKISSKFKRRLTAVNNLEKSFYKAEKAANKAKDMAQNAYDTVSGWFS